MEEIRKDWMRRSRNEMGEGHVREEKQMKMQK